MINSRKLHSEQQKEFAVKKLDEALALMQGGNRWIKGDGWKTKKGQVHYCVWGAIWEVHPGVTGELMNRALNLAAQDLTRDLPGPFKCINAVEYNDSWFRRWPGIVKLFDRAKEIIQTNRV